MTPKVKKAGVKRRASNVDMSLHEDEAERKRFSEVVEKRLKLDDAMSRRSARIAREQEVSKHRGVIYIGHIPHGFYEDELRKYFSQFGEVTRVRVSRSRKTGGSRGYAFVEFLHDSVAKVAADTMDGYLMFERLLKCSVVPKEKVHPDMFSPRFPFPLNREITRTFINMERTETRVDRNKELRLSRLQQQMDSLKDLGIAYNVTPIGSEVSPKAVRPEKPVIVESESRKEKPRASRGSPSAASAAVLVKKKKKIKRTVSDEDSEQHILLVDSEDDEIEFKTPPHSIRKLKPHPKTAPVSKSLEKSITNRVPKKRMSGTPKRFKNVNK